MLVLKRNRYKDQFYNLAVEAGFYEDVDRVIVFFFLFIFS